MPDWNGNGNGGRELAKWMQAALILAAVALLVIAFIISGD